MHAFARAEKLPKPKLGEMFTDVWAVKKGEQVPAVIVSDIGLAIGEWDVWLISQSEQRAELGRLLKKYGEAWKPWKEGLKKFAEQGEDVMDTDGRGA
jgi:2-oxoisovalerate dehydrogenase E1 component alpha subunit